MAASDTPGSTTAISCTAARSSSACGSAAPPNGATSSCCDSRRRPRRTHPMDFNDTPEEAKFRAEARAWLDANAEKLGPGERRESPLGGGEGRKGLLEKAQAWQRTKADARWACITWPTEYGGRGASSLQNVVWGQEENRYRVPPNMFTIGQGMLGPTIMAHGTPEQKKRYLQPMLRADEIWCQLFSEPAAGSDLAGLRTTAVKDGDSWVIKGQKIWTTGAHYSDWGMI